MNELAVRPAFLPVLTIERTGSGWRTPVIYLSLRKLAEIPGAPGFDAIEDALKTEMAARLGIPKVFVIAYHQQSWVDPRGRCVFHLEATPPPKITPAALAMVPASQQVVDV